jgi:hypothetical protein
MNDLSYLPLHTPLLKSYVCKASVEPRDAVWYAHCPALLAYGAFAWGSTQEAAVRQLQMSVERIIAELLAGGETLPDGVVVSPEPLVSIVAR